MQLQRLPMVGMHPTSRARRSPWEVMPIAGRHVESSDPSRRTLAGSAGVDSCSYLDHDEVGVAPARRWTRLP